MLTLYRDILGLHVTRSSNDFVRLGLNLVLRLAGEKDPPAGDRRNGDRLLSRGVVTLLLDAASLNAGTRHCVRLGCHYANRRIRARAEVPARQPGWSCDRRAVAPTDLFDHDRLTGPMALIPWPECGNRDAAG